MVSEPREKLNSFWFTRIINFGNPSSDRVSFRSPFPSPKAFRSAISWSENPHHCQHFSGDIFPVTFLKAPEPKTDPHASHVPLFSGGLNPTHRHVRVRGPLSGVELLPAGSSDAVLHFKASVSPLQTLLLHFFAFQPLAGLLSASSGLRRQLPSLAETSVRLGKASSSSTVTFLLCLGPDIPGSSSTAVIRPPFRVLFDPNVIQSQFMGQGYESHLVTPEDAIPDVDKVQWKKIDAQLSSVLWKSVDPKILHHLCAYKTCFKFWTRAKGLYTNDIQRFYKVVSDIVHVRQQDMDLSTYIGRIASLKEEFLTLMPFTNGAEAQQIQTDKFFMVLTLIGVCPDLESVRDQILASPSVPSLDDVFARLLRLSSTQTLSTDGPSDSSVLASQTNSRGGRSGNRGQGQRPQCTYCNKLGHTRDRCYQLHGRPPRTAHIA
ncbi:hypothetical protein CK203_072476 [Vitis vinifera]|uniref:Retrovirus-related Pol polyprotein from transposon RE2 n=2 Tax=Vitis vinifera TaxID=29760 RepID=A0A438F8Z6_VITVI|nr:hypothetical protein CK203_072476 [Vitis vinifera]